jgi:hypothetical protein
LGSLRHIAQLLDGRRAFRHPEAHDYGRALMISLIPSISFSIFRFHSLLLSSSPNRVLSIALPLLLFIAYLPNGCHAFRHSEAHAHALIIFLY